MTPDAPGLLSFWFGDLKDGLADQQHRARWFDADDSFDAQCRAFEPVLQGLHQSGTGSAASWLNDPRSVLAHIILCDQIPRNIYRGTSRAFAWDHIALTLAREGVARGDDRDLGLDERSFFYMPFEHSEALTDQHMAVGLFTFLRDESEGAARNVTGNALRYAQKHRDIIARFGRFPHRNAALGRTSSDAELAFVAASDGFGQTPPAQP